MDGLEAMRLLAAWLATNVPASTALLAWGGPIASIEVVLEADRLIVVRLGILTYQVEGHLDLELLLLAVPLTAVFLLFGCRSTFSLSFFQIADLVSLMLYCTSQCLRIILPLISLSGRTV